MIPLVLSYEDFVTGMRRWFYTDDLSEELCRCLYMQWQEFAEDEQRVRDQFRQWDKRNRVGHGYAWWETEQFGKYRYLNLDPIDRAYMFLTAEPPPDGPLPRPKPRPFCPAELVGRWRCVAVRRRSRDEPVAVTEPREWHLGADGILTTVGDPERHGWPWYVHRQVRDLDQPTLWLGGTPPDILITERWSVWNLRGDRMETHRSSPASLYWERIGS